MMKKEAGSNGSNNSSLPPLSTPPKKSPGIAAGAEAVSFRRRKMIQKETSTTMLGPLPHFQVP
jgi:hypothetical protein